MKTKNIYHPLDWILLAAAVVFFLVCAARYAGGIAAVRDSAPAASIQDLEADPGG